MSHKVPWIVSVVAFCFLGGALGVSSIGLVSAGTGNPTMTANQGASGTQAWKVDGSGVTQPVSGSVGVNNFPATQSVSGTVDIGNLPSTQAVSGTVDVGNFPAQQPVISADETSVITSQGLALLPPGSWSSFTLWPLTDVSAYKDVRVVATCASCTSASTLAVLGGRSSSSMGQLGTTSFTALGYTSGATATLEFDTPGPKLVVEIYNGEATNLTAFWDIIGRSN
jgi:hypothetical protein